MKLDYDRSADVLYVTFATSKVRAQYLETKQGRILRINPRTGKVLGCTIPMFSRRAAEGELIIPEAGKTIPRRQLAALFKH